MTLAHDCGVVTGAGCCVAVPAELDPAEPEDVEADDKDVLMVESLDLPGADPLCE